MSRRHGMFVTWMLCGALFAACPRPAPAPRSRPTATSATRRASPRRASDAGPRASAPRGPDIAARLMLTVQVGPTHRLDGRVRRWLRGVVTGFPGLPRRLFSRAFLSGLCRDMGLTPLVLDSLDLRRPAVLGVIFGPTRARAKGIPDLQWLAMIPYTGRGDIVVDALLASYPGSSRAVWGGVRVRRGSRDVAWVRLLPGWVVVAPSAPLLDSADRALRPLARGLPEGEIRAVAHADRILARLRPFFHRAWSKMQRLAGRMPPERMGVLEGLLLRNLDLLEEMAGYVGSVQRLEARLRVGDARWEARVRVTPAAGGKTATWLASQSAPDPRLAAILPAGSAAVSLARTSEALRGLPSRLLRTAVDWLLPRLERELPHVVRARGLFRKTKPVPYLAYRRTLRDLNLKDYRASYALYRLIFQVRALAGHTRRWGAKLLATEAGAGASALYLGKGGGLGIAEVKAVRDARAHRRAMNALMMGYQRLWNRLLVSLFRLLPKRLRARLGLSRVPARVVFNPIALRVRGVSVASLAIHLRWPKVTGGAPTREAAELATARRYVEALLARGPLTYAWAYVGRRLLVAGGRGWQGRMRALIRAARSRAGSRRAGGASAVGVAPRLLSPSGSRSGGAIRLLDTAVSLERWIAWGLDVLPRIQGSSRASFGPMMAALRARIGPLSGGPASAVRLTADRQAGGLNATLSMPVAALRTLVQVGALMAMTAIRSSGPVTAGAPPVSLPARKPAPPAPLMRP